MTVQAQKHLHNELWEVVLRHQQEYLLTHADVVGVLDTIKFCVHMKAAEEAELEATLPEEDDDSDDDSEAWKKV